MIEPFIACPQCGYSNYHLMLGRVDIRVYATQVHDKVDIHIRRECLNCQNSWLELHEKGVIKV